MARDHLLPAREQAGQPQRVLVGLGSAEREEERVQVARSQLGEQLAQAPADLGRELRRGKGEGFRLLGDGVSYAAIAMADVDAHQLAVEVDVALAVGVPEVDPLGAVDDDRVDLRLRGPREEGVLEV